MRLAALSEEGVRLQRQGADAADRYAQVLRVEPTNADALYRLAQVSCQQGHFEAGVELARRARFARHIEAAYATMWQMAQRGKGSRNFAVDPVEA